MRKSIKVPISKMIDLLSKISSGGRIIRKNSTKCDPTKISFLFQHEISMFYSHFTLTRNLLKNSTNIYTAVNYQIFFKKYVSVIFSMFFKIKFKISSKKVKIATCFVKNLSNYSLYLKTKKLIGRFMEKEESKFNMSKIRKNTFLINRFLDSDDECATDDDSKIEEDNKINNKINFINNNINNNIDNC